MHTFKLPLLLGVLASSLAMASPMSLANVATTEQLQGLQDCAGDLTCLAGSFQQQNTSGDDAQALAANKPLLFKILGGTGWNPAVNLSITDEQIASLAPTDAAIVVDEINKFFNHHGVPHLQVAFDNDAFAAEAAAISAGSLGSRDMQKHEHLKGGQIGGISVVATIFAGMFLMFL